jgi:hypothetical protein
MGEPMDDYRPPRRDSLTKKEKRIGKKMDRRAERFLRQFALMKQGRNPCRVSG